MSVNEKKATWIEGMPDKEGFARFIQVGGIFYKNGSLEAVGVTAITIQGDLAGPLCFMRRACVWSGGELIAEFPVVNLQGIGYI